MGGNSDISPLSAKPNLHSHHINQRQKLLYIAVYMPPFLLLSNSPEMAFGRYLGRVYRAITSDFVFCGVLTPPLRILSCIVSSVFYSYYYYISQQHYFFLHSSLDPPHLPKKKILFFYRKTFRKKYFFFLMGH